jgi:putative exosortase-associated protein (TIGR04073 family)
MKIHGVKKVTARRILWAAFFGCLFLAVPQNSYADEMWNKLGRGGCNIITSPGEMFYQTARLLEAGESEGIALMGGVPKGILVGFKRFGIGLFEVLTFPFKPYDKVYIQPEYLVSEL